MKLIELTDGLNGGNIKEYVDYESITNIMPRVRYSRNFLFGKLKSEIYGSRVFTKGGSETYVRETPEQIFQLIKNAKLGLSNDGISQEQK